jgi:CRP-like cAMP-binding protein
MSEPAAGGDGAIHPFLQGLSEEHRTQLLAGARALEASPGEHLAREGEPAHAFYLIQSGHVAIGTHLGERGAVPIQTVGPGDAFGWSWLVPPYRWQFDARVIDTVKSLVFDGAWLRRLCEQDTAFGYHLLRQLMAMVSQRLVTCRVQGLDIYR